MKANKTKTAILLSAMVMAGYGCKSTPQAETGAADNNQPAAVAALPDFETAAFAESVKSKRSKVELVDGLGATAGSKAIKVNFEGVSDANKNKYWPNIQMNPTAGVWDWTTKDSFTIDVTNPTDSDALINFKVVDQLGVTGGGMPHQLNHRAMIPAGSTENIEVVFRASLYSLPGYWGGDDLDLANVKELKVFIQGPIDAQTIIFDNFKLVDAPADL